MYACLWGYKVPHTWTTGPSLMGSDRKRGPGSVQEVFLGCLAQKPVLKLTWPLATPTLLVPGALSHTPGPVRAGRWLYRVCSGPWETVVLLRVDFFVTEEASFFSP